MGNFTYFIFGTIFALFLWILDKQRQPHLKVQVADGSNLDLPNGKYRIVNLVVKNKRRVGIKGFFNQTATQVRVKLTFKDYHTKKALFTITARWGTTREPLTPDYKQVDVGLALTNPREVISPGEEAGLSVAIKKSSNPSCHPFNNESYLHPNFAKTEWEITDDKFIVSVAVQSAEKDIKEIDFLVINKLALSQFNIVKL